MENMPLFERDRSLFLLSEYMIAKFSAVQDKIS